jgi:hypothetical protein
MILLDIFYFIIVYSIIGALALRAFKKTRPLEEAAFEAAIWPVTFVVWLWRKIAGV